MLPNISDKGLKEVIVARAKAVLDEESMDDWRNMQIIHNGHQTITLNNKSLQEYNAI